MEDITKDRIEQLVDYIMKNCLWQFHSRAWDREKQNEDILHKTMQILCDEPVEKEDPLTNVIGWMPCVWQMPSKASIAWMATLDKAEIKLLMQGLKERMDYLTITGSLNLSLPTSTIKSKYRAAIRAMQQILGKEHSYAL